MANEPTITICFQEDVLEKRMGAEEQALIQAALPELMLLMHQLDENHDD